MNLKKVDYKYKAVHLLRGGGEQRSENYLKLNPMGEVPSLEIAPGKILAQSLAICEFLEETHPQPALLPTDSYLRAVVRQFCENINSGIHPVANLKVTQTLEKEFHATAEQKKQWQFRWMSQGLAACEALVKSHSQNSRTQESKGRSSGLQTLCFLPEVTLAEVFLVPQIFSAKRFGLDLSPYPRLNAISQLCESLEPFLRAHPKNQPDFEDVP